MKDNRKKGIGLAFALNGLKEAFLRERNFRIHLAVTVLVLLAGFLFQLAIFEWMFIILIISIVLIVEFFQQEQK